MQTTRRQTPRHSGVSFPHARGSARCAHSKCGCDFCRPWRHYSTKFKMSIATCKIIYQPLVKIVFLTSLRKRIDPSHSSSARRTGRIPEYLRVSLPSSIGPHRLDSTAPRAHFNGVSNNLCLQLGTPDALEFQCFAHGLFPNGPVRLVAAGRTVLTFDAFSSSARVSLPSMASEPVIDLTRGAVSDGRAGAR